MKFDESRLNTGGPPTLRPRQPTWTVSPLMKTAAIRIHRCHLLLLLGPKAETGYTIPQTVKGWVDLGTTVMVCSPCCISHCHTAVRHLSTRPLQPASVCRNSICCCNSVLLLAILSFIRVTERAIKLVVAPYFCLFVCLSVSSVAHKRLNGFA